MQVGQAKIAILGWYLAIRSMSAADVRATVATVNRAVYLPHRPPRTGESCLSHDKETRREQNLIVRRSNQ